MVFVATGLFSQTSVDVLDDARKLYDDGEFKEVIELLESEYDIENQGGYEMLLGDAEHKMEFFDMAIHHYIKAEKSGIKTVDLYFHRGAAYISIGEFKKAIKDLNKAIKVDPENADLFFYRGYAHTEMENNDKALADYSNAILLKPDYAEAYYNRGAVKIDLGLLDDGIKDLEESSEIGGEELNISFNLAIIAYEKGEYEKAINLFEELIETEDIAQKLDAYYYLAECNYQLKETESACRYFYKAMALGDLDSEEIYHNYCEKGQLRKLFKTRRKTEKVTF